MIYGEWKEEKNNVKNVKNINNLSDRNFIKKIIQINLNKFKIINKRFVKEKNIKLKNFKKWYTITKKKININIIN